MQKKRRKIQLTWQCLSVRSPGRCTVVWTVGNVRSLTYKTFLRKDTNKRGYAMRMPKNIGNDFDIQLHLWYHDHKVSHGPAREHHHSATPAASQRSELPQNQLQPRSFRMCQMQRWCEPMLPQSASWYGNRISSISVKVNALYDLWEMLC